VVELQLIGVLGFDRAELDLTRLETMTREAFHAVVCRVRDVTERSAFDIRVSDGMSRADLERHVLRELIERDVRHLGDSAAWADLTVRLKQLALSGSAPEEILTELRTFRDAAPEMLAGVSGNYTGAPGQSEDDGNGTADGAPAEGAPPEGAAC
ncbi:MAG: hypothetical protein ACYDHO_08435, partial [Gaiellaceae bacterium]